MTWYTVTTDYDRGPWTHYGHLNTQGVYFNGYYYIFYMNDYAGSGIVYKYSTDGQNWTSGGEIVNDRATNKGYIWTISDSDFVYLFYPRNTGHVSVKKFSQNEDGTLSSIGTYNITSYNTNRVLGGAACKTTNRIYIICTYYDESNYRVKCLYSSDQGINWTLINETTGPPGGGGYPPSLSVTAYPPDGEDAVIFVGAKYSDYFYYSFYNGTWNGWSSHRAVSSGQYGYTGIITWDSDNQAYWYESIRNGDARVYRFEDGSWSLVYTNSYYGSFANWINGIDGNLYLVRYDAEEAKGQVWKYNGSSWTIEDLLSNERPAPILKDSGFSLISYNGDEDTIKIWPDYLAILTLNLLSILNLSGTFSWAPLTKIEEDLTISSSLSTKHFLGIIFKILIHFADYLGKSTSHNLSEEINFLGVFEKLKILKDSLCLIPYFTLKVFQKFTEELKLEMKISSLSLKLLFDSIVLFSIIDIRRLIESFEQVKLSVILSRSILPILFSTGFETGNYIRWDKKIGTSIYLTTEKTHHGTYALKTTGGSGLYYLSKKFSQYSYLSVRAYIWAKVTATSDDLSRGPMVLGFEFGDYCLGVALTASGDLFLDKISPGGEDRGWTPLDWPQEEWFRLEISYKFSTETFEVFVNDKRYSATFPKPDSPFTGIRIGSMTTMGKFTSTIYFDCIAVSTQHIGIAGDPPPPEHGIYQTFFTLSSVVTTSIKSLKESCIIFSKVLSFWIKKVLKEEDEILVNKRG